MDLKVVMTYGAITVSIITSLTFLAALAVAFLSHDGNNLTLLYGAIIGQFSTVISYWLGSSMGSQKKDEALNPLPLVVP